MNSSDFRFAVTFTPDDPEIGPSSYLAITWDDATLLSTLAGDRSRAGGRFTVVELPEVPPVRMVDVRFDRVVLASNRDADVFLARYNMPVVPAKGDTVNVNGHPFIVYECGFAVSDNGTYAYLRVVPATPWSPKKDEEDDE